MRKKYWVCLRKGVAIVMVLFCLEKQLPRDYIKLTCDPAVKLLKYLNLTMKFNYEMIYPKINTSFQRKRNGAKE